MVVRLLGTCGTSWALLMCGVLAWPGAQAAGSDALLATLRAGGHVLYFRHPATDWSQQDLDRQNLGDCRTQRNLSVQGRADATDIGRVGETGFVLVARIPLSRWRTWTQQPAGASPGW